MIFFPFPLVHCTAPYCTLLCAAHTMRSWEIFQYNNWFLMSMLCAVPLSAWQLQSIFQLHEKKLNYIEINYTVYMNRATNRMEQIESMHTVEQIALLSSIAAVLRKQINLSWKSMCGCVILWFTHVSYTYCTQLAFSFVHKRTDSALCDSNMIEPNLYYA